MRDWQDDAPAVTVLWDKRHTARQLHVCSACGEEIAIGARYQSVGVITDGEFSVEKFHGFGGVFPRECPRFADQDRAELEAQFETDREAFFG